MKLTLNKILVPTDFSKTSLLALDHACFMARLFKSELILLHVIEFNGTPFSLYDPLLVLPDLDELRKVATKKLEQLSQKVKKEYGVKSTMICSSGNSSAEIADIIKKQDVDLVIMGTHGAKGFNEFFTGSNTERTVTLSPCPVISVQMHAKKIGFANIVLPIDNGPHSRQKVDLTIAIAKKYGAHIHMLGLDSSEDKTEKNKFIIKVESVRKAVEEAGLAADTKVVKAENLAVAALKYAKKVKADLIVMMTGDESKLSGIYLGPFSRQILNHARIPVLSIPEKQGTLELPSLAGATGV